MSLLTVATGLALGGTAVSAVSQIAQGNNQANVMEANAKVAEQQAAAEQESAKQETLKLSRQSRQTIGTQAAMYGASGIDISSGSPLDVMARTAANYESDIQTVGYAGDTRAAADQYQADIYRYGAKAQRLGGYLGAGATLLNGVGKSLLMSKYPSQWSL